VYIIVKEAEDYTDMTGEGVVGVGKKEKTRWRGGSKTSEKL
jgi:hypothetical protein